MSDRPPMGLSRRRVLAGLVGVGAVGSAGGAGTFAYFNDAATLPGNELGTGEVAFDVTCDGACTAPNDGVVRFAVDGLDRGSTGSETIRVAVRTNPARLWLATTCPPARDPLGDALSVALRVGENGATVFAGSLGDLRREFVTGLRLDDHDGEACLDPAAELAVRLDWELPADVPSFVGDESTGVEFRLYTEQCRHVSETDAAGSNPFAGTPTCPDPDDSDDPACAVCDEDAGGSGPLHDLTLRYRGNESADLRVETRVTGRGGADAVVFEGSVDPDGTFLADGSEIGQAWKGGVESLGPETTVTVIDGGGSNAPGPVEIHTSCSVPIAPGDRFGPDGVYEVVAGTTTASESLCGSEKLQ